jgi:hypothetical protein
MLSKRITLKSQDYQIELEQSISLTLQTVSTDMTRVLNIQSIIIVFKPIGLMGDQDIQFK